MKDQQDIVDHGCASGFAVKHSTFNQTVEFFDKYKETINEYILKTINDCESFISEQKENSKGDIKKFKNSDTKSACEFWKKAAELGDEDAAKLLEEHCE